MNLKDSREYYQYFSGETSKIVRNLSFVGFAIMWLFKGVDVNNNIGFHHDLLMAAIWLILTLVFDFLQYVYGTAAWGIFNRIRECKNLNEKKDFNALAWINYPTNICFWFKLIFIAIAYFFLLKFLGYNTYLMFIT